MDHGDPESTRRVLEELAQRQFGGDPKLSVVVQQNPDGGWIVELRDRDGGWLMESIPADRVVLSAAARREIQTGDIKLDA